MKKPNVVLSLQALRVHVLAYSLGGIERKKALSIIEDAKQLIREQQDRIIELEQSLRVKAGAE